MPVDTPRGSWMVFDDFDMDNINTSAANGVRWLVSSDGGDTAFAVDLTAAQGGTAVGTISAADNQLVEIGHEAFMSVPQHGSLYMEVRCQIDDIANIAANIGFNDDALEDSNTLPVELSTTTFTANAAEFIGLVFDVDATNDDWHVIWVDDGSVATNAIANLRMNGASWKAASYWTFRVELQDTGSGNGVRAVFSVTTDAGVQYQKVFNTTLDRDASLTPYVGFETRSASAHNLTIDYIEFGGSRQA